MHSTQNINPNPVSSKPPINWGAEIKNAFRIIGKVLFKAFSYILNILLTVMLIALITGIIVGSAMAIYIKNYVDPEIDMSLFPVGQDQTTRIFVMDKELDEYVELEDQRLHAGKNGIWAKFKDMPDNLTQAFIAIEDKRFEQHNGFDIYRMGGAVRDFLRNFDFSSGGSTITQQLVKNITGDNDVRVQRKIEEIFRAINLENKKSKQEILELYLNIIPLGRGCYGVQAAANYYFGKDVSELTLIECVCIAAITNNPTVFDPERNAENNAVRRDIILQEMHDQGLITKSEFDSSYMKEIELKITKEEDDVERKTNSYFTDALIDKIIKDLMDEKGYTVQAANLMIYTGGLQIYSTVDMEIQTILEEFYQDEDTFPKSKTGIQPESAMVIVDPYTNDVVALVGGRGEKTLNRSLNRATQSVRPPGSAIKPISVYALALDEGYITYGSPVDDAPVLFGSNPAKPVSWPKNLPQGYDGLTSVHYAIEVSKNTVAVRVLQRITPEASFNFMKNQLSINSLIDSKELANGQVLTDKDLAALALGQLNYGLTVEEITAAYSIFQNEGVFNEPKVYSKVLDSIGNVVLDKDPKTRIVISAQTASIMTIMLEKVVDIGTARGITLKEHIDVAGKTGTAGQDYDRYFVGYTPYYVAGVWFGYDMPQSLSEFSAIAGNPACVVWDKVMTKIHQKFIDEAASGGVPLKTFTLAPGVMEAEYCKDSGKMPTTACKSLDPRGNRTASGYFSRQSLPSEPCDIHVVVDYCSGHENGGLGGVSLPEFCSCPPSLLRKVALIRIETRSFPSNVSVADAQYAYRELTPGVTPNLNGRAFFQNMLAYNEYAGGGGFNRICTDHYGLAASPKDETTAVETTALNPPEENPSSNENNPGGNTQPENPVDYPLDNTDPINNVTPDTESPPEQNTPDEPGIYDPVIDWSFPDYPADTTVVEDQYIPNSDFPSDPTYEGFIDE